MIIFVEIDIDGFNVGDTYSINESGRSIGYDLEIDDSELEGMSEDEIDNHISKAVSDSFSYRWSIY